jgi:hypothetical protein
LIARLSAAVSEWRALSMVCGVVWTGRGGEARGAGAIASSGRRCECGDAPLLCAG